jgi:integrase
MSSSIRNRRARGDGGYRKRGDAWELKFSATDPKTGQRSIRYVTFKGNETAARGKLRELVKRADDGAFIAPARQTFGEVLDAWEAGLNVSAKTAERYRELVALHIRPHLGTSRLQSLRASRIESFYSDLRDGRTPTGADGARPLAALTIAHIHRLVVQALALAERDGLIQSNPARSAKRPKVDRSEVEILSETQVRDVLRKLQGRPFYRVAALGLATGMRRGEICALRWKDVDLDGASLRVEQSLEQTKPKAIASDDLGRRGLQFKAPKTRYSRRQISLPASIVSELRALRREQQEERLKLGLGREPDGALVFRRLDPASGSYIPLVPNSVTTEWRRLVKLLTLPKVSLHAWRHTHASQLIGSGMDILTISRRLGHGSPSITLDVYGHLFKRKDDGAADVFEAAFSRVFTETDADEKSTASEEIGGKSVANPIALR